ncbi:MAG: hypothetical protein E7497_06830 [Ruminococcus sp.]|nr:hypothetical protein [Ruminococcus sp.]
MKNYRAKYLALALVAALAVSPLAGCDKDKDKDKGGSASGSSSAEPTEAPTPMLQVPFEFHYEGDESDEPVTGANLDAQDPTAPAGNSGSSDEPEFIPATDANGEAVTECVEVTDANGETVTEYVPVTDAEGEEVTDAEGQVQTEAVPVTEVVEGTVANPDYSGESGGDTEYTPYTDEAYAFWIDISKEADFIFNDEFISVTFKVRENAPDGVYDITITNPDFANFYKGGTPVKPDVVQNGKVFVSTAGEDQKEFTEDDGFVVYADNVECKQGDEIVVNFSLKNNPGLVGINFWFQFDRNALQLIDCKTAGEFADIANKASFGEADKSQAETSAE